MLSLLSTLSFGSASQKSVYFCTKDLDSLQSSPESVTGQNPDNKGNLEMQVYFPLENDKHTVFNFRHCFVTFASIDKVDKGVLHLKHVRTYGYGGNPNPQEHKKTGGAYHEPNLEGKVISCVPVFESSALSNSSEDIYDKWTKINRIMDEETESANYNTIGHNCCSVAYHAVKHAGGDISNINPSNFNLYGMGIHWGQTIGNVTDYLTVSTHNSINYVANIVNLSAQSEASSNQSEKGQDPEQKTEDL